MYMFIIYQNFPHLILLILLLYLVLILYFLFRIVLYKQVRKSCSQITQNEKHVFLLLTNYSNYVVSDEALELMTRLKKCNSKN